MKPYPHYIVDIAKRLRQSQTSAEKILWDRLLRHQLNGLKFKRQHRIGRYIADFFCGELRLIVEVEGRIHEKKEQIEYDKERFAEFEVRGYQVFRAKNEEVIEGIEDVLRKILKVKDAKEPSPLF